MINTVWLILHFKKKWGDTRTSEAEPSVFPVPLWWILLFKVYCFATPNV